MTDQTRLDQLRAFDLFSDLTADDLAKTGDQFVHQLFNEGEHIIQVSGEGADVFFLLSGSVRIVTYSIIGKELELTQFQAPGYFGELTAIDDTPRSAEVIALDTCECLVMTGADFRAFMLENPTALMKLAQKLARQLRQSNFQFMLNQPL